MILLFLSVWAIVIALNEVLFAAQPFTLASVAEALPHTLMFSVVLSAAVYLAKKKIIDAIEKGRPIDKRFVAELTPQVGHELNNMRRKLEHMDQSKGRVRAAQNQVRRNATAQKHSVANRKGSTYVPDPRYLPKRNAAQKNRRNYSSSAISSAAAAELSRAGRYSRNNSPLDDPKLKAAQEGLAALDAMNNAVDDLVNDDLQNLAAQSQGQAGQGQNNTQAAPRGMGKLASFFGHHDNNANAVDDMDDEEELTEAERAHEAELARRRATKNAAAFAKAHEQMRNKTHHDMAKSADGSTDEEAAANSRSSQDMAARRAQLAKERELQKERRLAQIAALSEVSQEDKAKNAAAAQAEAQNKKMREKAMKEAQAQAKIVAAHEFEKLKSNLNPFAKKEEVKGKTSKLTDQARAKAAAEQAAAEQAVAAAAAQAEAQVMAKAKAKAQAEAALMAQRSAEAKERNRMNLEVLQGEAKRAVVNAANAAQGGGSNGSVSQPGFVDQLEIPKAGGNSKLDTSSLKKAQGPKRGGGLDTSALKKATLPKVNAGAGSSSSITSAVAAAASGALAGTKMLKTKGTDAAAANSVLGRAGNLGVNSPQAQGHVSSAAAGAAMSTTIENDATIARGKAQALGLAQFQANARARALARAQTPKATAQAQFAAAASGRAMTSGPTTADSSTAPKKVRAVGNASTIGMNNARGGLPTKNMSGQDAPIRKVVSTSLKPQVGPNYDSLPKVRPSDPLANIQTAPKLKGKGTGVSQKNREQLLRREPNFVNAAAAAASSGVVGTTSANTAPLVSDNAAVNAATDMIHAQAQASAYSQVQHPRADQSSINTSDSKGEPLDRFNKANAARESNHRTRARPSDRLRTDQQA